MSLTIQEMHTLARDFNLIPYDPYCPRDLNTWQFTEPQLVNSCWLIHTFAFADSPLDCIQRKVAAQEEERADDMSDDDE